MIILLYCIFIYLAKFHGDCHNNASCLCPCIILHHPMPPPPPKKAKAVSDTKPALVSITERDSLIESESNGDLKDSINDSNPDSNSDKNNVISPLLSPPPTVMKRKQRQK